MSIGCHPVFHSVKVIFAKALWFKAPDQYLPHMLPNKDIVVWEAGERHRKIMKAAMQGRCETQSNPVHMLLLCLFGRSLQFVIKIGSAEDARGCRKPQSRDEGIVVDYSTDNGITWNMLRVLDPETASAKPQSVNIDLVREAKTAATIIRWWQPIVSPGVILLMPPSLALLCLMCVPFLHANTLNSTHWECLWHDSQPGCVHLLYTGQSIVWRLQWCFASRESEGRVGHWWCHHCCQWHQLPGLPGELPPYAQWHLVHGHECRAQTDLQLGR